MIKIPVGNGVNLVAEQSTDGDFEREIYIGLVDDNDSWLQDLVVVTQSYDADSDKVKYINGEYEVFVYADKNNDCYTHKFDIEEYRP